VIASPNFESRNGATVRLIVVHTAEGALTTTELGNFFANPASQVSSHVGIDDHGIEQYVDYTNASWTMLSANPISEHAELCGFAAWTRDQWLTQHTGMLGLAARWVRERCLARGIPIIKLTPAQVAAGQAGVIGHWDWTVGMNDGTHTDPGSAFPWDVVISLAQQGATPAPAPAPSAPREVDPVTAVPITVRPDGTFRGTLVTESGGNSQVVAQAWLDMGSTWGGCGMRATALGNNGNVLAVWPPTPGLGTIPNNATVMGVVLPPGTCMVTVEGKVADPNAGTIPAASVVSKTR